ncbi:unnamed protein product [Pneumocystis jirovecii]|uniref:RRM domain-containing protein n=1 Tax=Pneumocystis jirovecii TaxID=42068 RepID=L0PC76_PNEJI|nr:unnamed protein product [Pneumocystis jirovecii]CCJ31058.1 unnamed protein product [Pneumocystis jirovecii]
MKDRVRGGSLRYADSEKSNLHYTKKSGFSHKRKRSLDIHKQWSHDLFNQKNEFTTLSEEKQKKLASNPLFCRLMGIKNTQPEKELLNNPLYMRMQGVQPQTTIKGTAQGKSSWTIKGASGATTVIVSNLAEGTTAEDVKTSLASLGHIQKCFIYKMNHGKPLQAEVTFSLRSEANTAVEKLNHAIADGHVLTVYIKEN